MVDAGVKDTSMPMTSTRELIGNVSRESMLLKWKLWFGIVESRQVDGDTVDVRTRCISYGFGELLYFVLLTLMRPPEILYRQPG